MADTPALNFWNDPGNQGILTLATQLMANSGPSPYPHSFLNVLGQSGGPAMQAVQNQQNINQQRALGQQQLIAAQIANRFGQYKNSLLPDPQGASQTPQGPSDGILPVGSPASPQSAYTPSGGLTPLPQPTQPQAAPIASGNASGGIPQLPGMSPLDSARAAMGIYSPGFVSALTQAPNALASKGYVPDGQGGYQMAPWFSQGAGVVAGAQAQAKLPSEAVTSFLRYAGRPSVVGPTQRIVSGFDTLPSWVKPIIQQGVMGQAAQPGTQGAPTASAGAGGTPPPLTPFQESSQKDRAAKLEDYGETLTTSAQNAVKDNSTIDAMKSQMGGFEPGKFAPAKAEIGAYLMAIPGVKNMLPAGTKDGVAAYQEFEKNATNLSMAAARTMGAREPGSVISMFKNAYPNTSLTDQTLGAMFAQIHGMNDYHVATQKAADEWRNSPQNMEKGTLAGFQAQWNKSVDPMMFIYDQMPDKAQKAFAASLSPMQRQQFAAKFSSAVDAGYLPPVGK